MTRKRHGAAPAATRTETRLESWLFETALPYWAARGVDTEAGGFHERLDRVREPVVRDGKRAMVQARQIYVFAQAAALGRLPDGARLARSGRDFLLAHYRHPDGGWRFRVTRSGEPLDDTRDLYTHAFVLYALAWLHRLDSGSDARVLADTTVAFLDRRMAHPEGGYHEALDGTGKLATGVRRQNPHMHLFETFLEWYAATQDGAWLDRAQKIGALMANDFCAGGTLREYFDDGLVPLTGGQGQIVEPGHHYEWTWLLHRYRQLANDARYETLAAELYAFAETYGVDAQSGGVFDAVAPDGTPMRKSRRFWPQTEALKAHAARFEATGDPAIAQRLNRQIEAFCGAHLDGAPGGGWREHLGEDGAVIVPDLPASSLYHVTLAAAELSRLRAP